MKMRMWLLLLALGAVNAGLAGCATTQPTPEKAPEAAKVAEPPKKTPKGVLSGRVVRNDTKAPVGELYLSLRSENDYLSAYTDGYGRFRAENVPAGSYTVQFYEDGYKQSEFGPYTVGEDQQVLGLTIGVDPVDPQLTPYTYQDVYRPNENVAVMVRSIRVTSVDVDLYRVPDALVRSELSRVLARKNMDLSRLETLMSYKQPIAGGGALTWRTTPVQPAFDKPGVYVLRLRGGSSDVVLPLVVTDLSLITKRGPSSTVVFAQNITTSEPMGGVQIVPEWTGATGGATGLDGLATLPNASPDKNVRLWGFAGPHVAYVDTVPAASAAVAPYRALIITDRPIYRTGHEVHYKVIARADEGGSYRVRPGEAWTVILRDALGRNVASQTGTTNLFGTFSGSFQVDDEAALGGWNLLVENGAVTATQDFEVQEYRKPEFELQVRSDASQVVQGEDVRVTVQGRYYFGAPLADADVYYTVYEAAWAPWRDFGWGDSSAASVYEDEDRWSNSYGYGRALTSGTVKLDAEGKGVIDVGVPAATYDRKVTIEVSATDASDREVSARQSLLVSAGTFGLALNADGYIFKASESIPVSVLTKQFDGSGVPARVKVTASVETWNEKHKMWVYKTVDTRTVETGAKGEAKWGFSANQAGVLRIDAVATDTHGNAITDTRFLWVTTATGVGGWQKKKSMEIVVDKGSYKPGETARVLVNSQVGDVHVLFTIEDALGVRKAQVVKLSGNSRFFEVPLVDADAPTLYLGATFASEKQLYATSRALSISPASRMLEVTIGADKEIYAPGETATLTVRAKDATGAPVEAEVALSVVDEAIYALASDNVPEIGGFFYGPRQSVVTTSYSFPSRYLGGASKDGGDGVRRNFKDTAYWSAHVTTGKDGSATAQVTMPDNLTTWRIMGRAVTADVAGKSMRVGQGRHSIVTAKDLIARVLPPRFVMVGDRVELVGQVHNLGESAASVAVRLELDGPARIEGAASSTLSLASGEQAVTRWPVTVTGAGELAVRIYAKSDAHTDAMELKVPAMPVAVPRSRPVSGLARGALTARFEVPAGAVPGTSRLRLELTPSLAGLALESLDELARFPYGCVEQTMSAFLPDIAVQLALADLGQKNQRLEAKLPVMVARGMARIERLQHEDGGWGWWENDASRPFMTAYVMFGLALAEQAGFEVDPDLVDRGAQALLAMMTAEQVPPTRAYAALALALRPDPDEAVPALVKELATRQDLDPWTMAVLAQAADALEDTATRDSLASALAARATREDDVAWLAGSTFHYGWNENRFETTAMALRALVASNPQHELVAPLVRYLVRHRTSGMWDTTRDTAMAILALVDVLRTSGEGQATYTARVSVDGKEVAALDVKPDNALSLRQAVTLDAAALGAGEHEIGVKLEGQGTLYWSGGLRFGDSPEPRDEGLTLSRTYRRVVRSADDQGTPTVKLVELAEGGVNVGDELEVTLNLSTDTDREYVIVEDPLAAGFEVRPHSLMSSTDDGSWGFWYSHFEIRDEKVAFFATSVPKGKHTLSYRIRAEAAGTVTAAPAAAWNMYLPSIAGNSAASTLQVAPRK
ncbi:MAG: hypothetical protein AMXMBFR64_48180 [Myxococcales bacterium]